MLRPRHFLPLLLACESAGAGSPWDDADFAADAQRVAERYAHVVGDSYRDTRIAAEAMQAEIEAFLAAPSAAGLQAARDAWKAARERYGQTEAYRFYGGPIDVEPGGPEGRLNSWPMDEVYVDYVDGQPDAGIINDPAAYPTIDRDVLVDLNAAGSETDISTGWHAIEFLLWGQDLADDGPGARPWTDYVVGEGGTAAHQDRRADYLRVVTALLVDDLRGLEDAWAEGAAYHEEFAHQDPQAALTKMLLGMGSLSGAELAGERMTVAYDTREQEDEHSCFSDTTHRDLVTNAQGIENVYLGRWGGDVGASLSDLVAARDPELDRTMRSQLAASVAALEAIPPPFDQAIRAPDGDPARAAVADAIAALKDQTATTVAVATLLEISLNLEE
jgi:putative iron-regulated protein